MLKLRSISLRNWCKTADSEIVFPSAGYVHVRGLNRTAVGQVDSSGAGKTALGEAINRAALGASLSSPISDYSRDGDGDTYVKLVAELRGLPLTVEIGYKCPEFPDCDGEGLRFSYGDQPPCEHPRVAQTRAELSDLIGVSPDASMWTVFIDGERLKFNRMSQDAALTLLMQAMNQPPWGSYRERAAKRKSARELEVERASTKLDQAKMALDAANQNVARARLTLGSAKDAFEAAWAQHEERVEQHRADVKSAADVVTRAAERRDDLKRRIREAEKADAEKFGRLELERSRLMSERRQTESYLAGWRDNVSSDASDLKHARQELEALKKGKACPTCGHSLKGPATPQDIAKAERKIAAIEARHAKSVAGRDECQGVLNSVDKDLDALDQQRASLKSSEISGLSSDLEVAEEALSRADRRLRETELRAPQAPSDSEVKRAQAVLAEREERVSGAEADVQVAASDLAQAERNLRVAAYWWKAFSPEGIPNLVLRQTVAPLNDAARLVSEALSGGVVKVSFAADSELASGALKPKLVTEVQTLHGATKLSRNSKGEVGRANLIIAETQTQVGRVLQRVGYRWFDEIVNSQDPVVRRNIYSYIRRQAHERGVLSFVVDHHEEVAAYADHTLVAEKSPSGLTTYRWE